MILAAGRGTRMRSRLAKVLHPLLGRPLVGWTVTACQEAGMSVCLVVNHQEEAVRAAFSDGTVSFARQEVPRGTGDAVSSGMDRLPAEGTVVVLPGDAPLIEAGTLEQLLVLHHRQRALCTLLSADMAEPGAFGRIVRNQRGEPVRIVEAAECTPEEAALTEINAGIYAFDIAWLRAVLPGLQPHPPKGEIYLTDALELAAAEGRSRVVLHPDADELFGVNDRVSLAHARTVLQRRILAAHSRGGVTFEHPASTVVHVGVRLARDVSVGPGCVLRGQTSVGEGTTLDAHCVLDDAVLGAEVRLLSHSVLEGAEVGNHATVGPFARLRPAADVREGAKIGNFVEVKKSVVEAGAKVSHLSYIGDATVGRGANVGAGTITCNYDGFGKHRTDIGPGAFIGSNSALVAPVSVGAGALVGAGAVIVQDVPPDAVAVARGEQRNHEGAAPRFRARAETRAKAAKAARAAKAAKAEKAEKRQGDA